MFSDVPVSVIHLPRAWTSYALISILEYGWLPALVSMAWMAVSALRCAHWAAQLASGLLVSVAMLSGKLGIFTYGAPHEETVVGQVNVGLWSLAIRTAECRSMGAENRDRDRVLIY